MEIGLGIGISSGGTSLKWNEKRSKGSFNGKILYYIHNCDGTAFVHSTGSPVYTTTVADQKRKKKLIPS